MKHPDENELIVHHYGEAGDDPEVAGHLANCAACRARYQTLERTLALVDTAPVPERNEAYGKEVWRRLAPDLPRPARAAGIGWLLKAIKDKLALPALPRWTFAGGLALLVAFAFLAGRFW